MCASRSMCILGLAICAIGLAAGQLSAGPFGPIGPPQPTELSLSIYEVTAPVADLEKLTEQQLAAKARDKQAGRLAAEFKGTVDFAGSVTLKNTGRLPVLKPGKDGQPGNISMETTMTELVLSGSWAGSQAKVELQATLTGSPTPGLPLEQKEATKKISLKRSVQVVEDGPVWFKFEDKPTQVGDQEFATGRLHMGFLNMRRLARGGGPAGGAAGDIANLDLEVFSFNAEREKIDGADLGKLVADRPAGSEILGRLKTLGEASRSTELHTSFDLGSGFEVKTGARVPTVQDITISRTGTVTPSVSYVDVGTIFETRPSGWEGSGNASACTVYATVETSGVTQSGVEVNQGVKLPVFTTTSVEGLRRFQSGRPEYFVYRGAPVPPGENARVFVCVVRIVLTRGE